MVAPHVWVHARNMPTKINSSENSAENNKTGKSENKSRIRRRGEGAVSNDDSNKSSYNVSIWEKLREEKERRAKLRAKFKTRGTPASIIQSLLHSMPVTSCSGVVEKPVDAAVAILDGEDSEEIKGPEESSPASSRGGAGSIWEKLAEAKERRAKLRAKLSVGAAVAELKDDDNDNDAGETSASSPVDAAVAKLDDDTDDTDETSASSPVDATLSMLDEYNDDEIDESSVSSRGSLIREKLAEENERLAELCTEPKIRCFRWSDELVTGTEIVPRLADHEIDDLFYQDDEIGEMRHTAFLITAGLEEDPPEGPDVPPVPWGDALAKLQQDEENREDDARSGKQTAQTPTVATEEEIFWVRITSHGGTSGDALSKSKQDDENQGGDDDDDGRSGKQIVETPAVATEEEIFWVRIAKSQQDNETPEDNAAEAEEAMSWWTL